MFGGWGTEMSEKVSWVKPKWQEALNCCLCTAALALKWVREQQKTFTSQAEREESHNKNKGY